MGNATIKKRWLRGLQGAQIVLIVLRWMRNKTINMKFVYLLNNKKFGIEHGLLARLLAPASSIEANPTPANEFSTFTSLYSASPYYQFTHFIANQAITEAFKAKEHRNGGALHVVDLDVSHGFQVSRVSLSSN
ncbi:hypothetical protein HPP92_023008 [Vanilla planifolia]|uniref:Uncharacterized protein n=1 Tax=Vanilla planifolia TaxID=51239 RepID=A0A835PPJ6_VANPL|nr:hypothetical protein HPP92_023008 [Vanilla planifolia]